MDDKGTGIFADFLPEIKNLIKAETVFGDPYQVGEVTLIPVNSVKVGFGVGGGNENNKAGQGGGGGILLSPVAFIVIKNGEVTIQSLNSGTIENVMSKVPDVVERFINLYDRTTKKKTTPNNSEKTEG